MTNTATGPPLRAAETARPGPLLSLWGAAASPGALARVLLDPGRALPAPDLAGEPARRALEPVRERAEAERGSPWPQPLASQYARYFQDGDRTVYERNVFDRQDRLTRAVLMAAATGDDGWLAEAADGIVLLCEQSSWCWPAHEESCRPRGAVLPDPAAPCLDLGAGDVAAQLAWADQAIGERLDERFPGVRERVRAEVRARVLEPFTRRRDWHWLGLDGQVHNWCPWICGNVLVAALRLAEPGEERALQVTLAVEGVDRYLAALPPDGSVDEGYEYWWNGACRALEALDVLAHATSGVLDAAGAPVVRATVRFPYLMHLGGGWYVNVADARARPPAGQPWDVLHRWAQRVGDPDGVRHAAAQRATAVSPAAELGRVMTALGDPAWLEAEAAGPPLVASAWLPGTQMGVARAAGGTDRGLALVVKGGHNAENHNHNDVGSVIVAVDGVPAVVDAGRPTYTARTFGPDRYAIWTMRGDWHNVPEVRGTPQRAGASYRARDVEVADEPGLFRVRLDLAAAYPVGGLERWWRTALLDRSSGEVTIEDAWRFTGDGEPSALRFLLAGEVRQDGPGEVEVRPPGGGRAAVLTWDPERAAGSLTVRELDDPMLTAVWGDRLTRLELALPGTAEGSVLVRVGVRG
ncbi:heparinase II/III family protein [Nonomuraea sp. C10]|uniref:heparinase II/III domain-containing protein n=2 Tax=Nonomuraea TaxID=83681 RepID=UPI0011CE7967|nr:heparinase II/III family protein [Nonomuraea sp. C10]TXK42496.1 hypothetical protein FR742_25630 [Nonomuraea sp. C10]